MGESMNCLFIVWRERNFLALLPQEIKLDSRFWTNANDVRFDFALRIGYIIE